MTAGDAATGDSPKAHYGKIDDPRLSAEEMDERRKANVAYEYLCHLEEAKIWIEACTSETLPPSTEMEEGLRNGVFLAKLGHFMSPEVVPVKKIYDRDQARYQARGLHFRHTDNINHWLKALQDAGFPKIFYPETTDIYDRKNIPRLIYCIHALSLYLFKLGKAPQIQDLYGKVKFTDEEISAMRKALEQYGIQMPAFSKIGGILANEMPVDEAALHAAVIAINDAIDKQVAEDTVSVMRNPVTHLNNIYEELTETYQDVLYEAKETKAEIARNKSLDPDSSYIPDVYDELLTQAEIQGNLNKVNTLFALGNLQDALAKGDRDAIIQALQAPQLKIKDVHGENIEFYTGRLLEVVNRKSDNNNEEDRLLAKDEVQMVINAANLDADSDHQKSLVVKLINEAVDKKEKDMLVTALQNPHAQLPGVNCLAAALYLHEFGCIKTEKQSNLEYEEIVGGLEVLTAVAKINQAIESGSVQMTFSTLGEESAHVAYLDEGCKAKYQQALEAAKSDKSKTDCEFLTHFDIQQCINEVNQQVIGENDRIEAIGLINEAIEKGVAMVTFEALVAPTAHLTGVEGKQALHYQHLLKERKQRKAVAMDDDSAVLWLEEIQDTIAEANRHATDANKLSLGVAAANIAVENEDSRNLLTCLQNSELGLHSVTDQCVPTYLRKLQQFREKKAGSGETGGGWMMNRLREGHKFFFNVQTMEYSWNRPDGVKKDHTLLTKEEIQSCICEVTASYDRQLLYKSNERFIVKVQAAVRGFLARQHFNERMDFMHTQLPAIITIQSWWRMVMQRQRYQKRMNHYRHQEDAVIALQAAVRMHLVRSKYQQRINFFRRNEKAIVKIQSFMRANWAKQDYRVLMHGQNPHMSVVRKFVHLLDICDLDYSEEIDIQKLREHVVTEIRSNQQLENDLNEMDIKIGLLVKNRITLQDVISQHKTLKHYKEHTGTGGSLPKGLKALSKASRERLEAYQHLFYLLQTNPVYLAKLIFEMPQSRTTRFMESVILTIYNYASNQREEFLLLKLFKTALEEEIRSKVDKMSDIVTGNPMVVKMIVSYNRNARGQGVLRELLNPLVCGVIEDRNLQINTNPTEVYKQWVNQMETQTGRASGLPYDATIEQALEHEEVQVRIQDSIQCLQKATDKFLTAILSSVHKIPYGMRYMARVMKEALHSKFPEAAEKDVLKIVGNLIYYRYINSAIVAPDAFDIIDVVANKGLTNDQRRNLGSIAKILQFAASNKGFGGDSAHLSCLNSYIMEAHSKFKRYFRSVCDVEEPEVTFNMDQYTDVTRVTKPVIYISIAEMIDTHKSLLEHQDAIAADHTDPLHELLDDLGDVPDMEALIGDAGLDENTTNRSQLAKTEISLTLSNKFEVPEDDRSDLKNILIRTKRMVVDVIRCQRSGDSLVQILNLPASDQEESEHQLLVKKRERVDMKASRQAKLVRQQSMSGDTRLPLETMKVKIFNHLQHLGKAGMVSEKDGYQAIINSIVQDIRNQRLYRQRRKQEMVRLRHTLRSLGTKRSFFEEQIDYYNQYVKTCLDNLSTKGKKAGRKHSRSGKEPSKHKAKGSVKYSAARLHEKGIVLEIEGLPTNQFKNVLFEFTASEQPGVFDLSAKFMGVNMEKVQLIFQDLLQLQYEGVAVMKMFDRAKVNVNLLIFMLNKKFYGK